MSDTRILNTRTAEAEPGALILHGSNPRRGDLAKITESFRANGFWGTVIVDERNEQVLAGNHRVLAARELDMPVIPVTYVKPDSDEHALRILVADNRTSDVGTYDGGGLAQILDHLASTDAGLDGTGFDVEAAEALAAATTEPDADEWADAFGALPDGDRTPFQQKTFTLHDSQAETVEAAIASAKEAEDFAGSPNENSNGNALAAIARAYLELVPADA